MRKQRVRRWFGWIAAAWLLPAASACGGGGDSASDADADVEVGDVAGDQEETPDGMDGQDADASDGDGTDGDVRLCTASVECNDFNRCTIDECIGGSCRWTPVTDGTSCDDDRFCTSPGTCVSGECTGVVENDCDDGDDCTDDLCDDVMMECRHTLHPRPGAEGPLGEPTCEDGLDNDCDGQTDGEDANCTPCETAADCDDGNPCTEDSCNDLTGICTNAPAADGTPCEDGEFCTVDEACSAGVCTGGEPRDCSAEAPVCNVGRCHEGTDRCFGEPVPDGTPCLDDRYCTVNEACAAGACLAGGVRDCAAYGDACNIGVCDDDLGACARRPEPDGTPCDDGQACSVGESCVAGVCGGGMPRDCSALDGPCQTGVCDETSGDCFAVPLADGTACDDGLLCTEGTTCNAGACGGGRPTDCSALDGPCQTGVCDEASGCHAVARTAGTPCDDGLYCTTGESCTAAGACAGGAARSCADADVCTTDSCNETEDRCDNLLTPVPGAEGPRGAANCSDGVDNDCDRATDGADSDCIACTSNAQCNDGNPCTTDRCQSGACVNTPVANGTACDDGLYCTNPDTCTAGVCGGPARDCSSAGGPCMVGRCDEAGDRCYGVPQPDGTSCEDGLYCTTGDTCASGACIAGPARDCSALSGPCATGRCDEAGDRCVADPRPNGTTCDDGLYCTTPDTCTGGVCGGPARDCSALGDQCNAGTCNEVSDRCEATPRPDGTVCDADGSPTTRDVCIAGTCRFSTCGDGYRDTVIGECCDDGNTVTESCTAPPVGACVRDCSIRQDTCGNGTVDAGFCEACDDGNTNSMDACTTSCTVNDHRVGAPCTCTGSSCRMGNPTAGTITGCENVVVPTGALLACLRSGTLGGGNIYMAGGFCSAWAHRCSPSLLCSFAGIPSSVGSYSAFVGPCPEGSVLVQQTISASGVTLETKSCMKVCTRDADCRWNEWDTYFRQCGHYECTASPSTPGTRVCFDAQMSAP